MVRNRSDIIDFLSSHKEEPQQRFGATSIGLFGSYVRAEAQDGSDIDSAIDLRPEHKSLRQVIKLLDTFIEKNRLKQQAMGE